MIRFIKILVIAVFILFLAIYLHKVMEYEKVTKIFGYEERIGVLADINHYISDEVDKIVGNRYVNYDYIIDDIKRFQEELKKISKNELALKTSIVEELKKIKKSFDEERIIIEKIIQESAVVKSSFLYLPYLEKEIMLNGLSDKKIVDAVHETIELLSYQVFLRERGSNKKFYESLAAIKEFTPQDEKLAKLLRYFYVHSILVNDSMERLTPLLEEFKHKNMIVNLNIENAKNRIVDYEVNVKRDNLLFEGVLHSVLFIFAGTIFFFIYKEQKAENELKRMAEYDYLTGLPNRYRLLKDLKRKYEDKKVHIIKFDIDNFAHINEKFGSVIGDVVLKFFASLLEKECPGHSYRVTSDEFVAICENPNREEIISFFRRLTSTIKNRSPYYFTISAGAFWLEGKFDNEKVIYYLHSALYSAKKRGGDKLVFYEEGDFYIKEYSYLSHIGTEIKKEIEESIKEDRFVLCYQPIWSLKEKRVKKYEVLLRMQKGSSIIYPAEFIEFAERFNLIGKVTRIVIDKAFKAYKETGAPLSINLSGLDLVDESLISYIIRMSKKHDIDNSQITFEVTETAVVEDFERGKKFITDLKKEGFRFAIDDFGVGYSSLKYLHEIPVDYIKIDGSFIKDIKNSEKMQEFVKNIHYIIKSSGKLSIAEFVEDSQTLAILERIGIDYVQGYFIGMPAMQIDGANKNL